MIIKILQDISVAHAITHTGFFHIGDVLATAILAQTMPNLAVARVAHLPSDTNPDTLVYDLDGIIFGDYRQGQNGARSNGIPYSAAGHAWREFGPHICADMSDPPSVWQFVDQYLIQGVDASDYASNPFPGYPAQTMSIAQAISAFNPQRNAGVSCAGGVAGSASDHAFVQAVEFMSTILQNVIRCADAAVCTAARSQLFIQSSGSNIMPWDDIVMEEDTAAHEYGEDLGTKLCEAYGKAAYVQSDGTIRVVKSDKGFSPEERADDIPVLKELLRSCGYHGLQYHAYCHRLIFSYNGRNIEELKDELKQRAARNEAKRENYEDAKQRWAKQLAELGGLVIGITDVDKYDCGFSVWLMLNTKYTFEQQREIVRSKPKNIVAFAREELTHKKKFKRQADLLPFCHVVEITVTRQNAVVVKYELKPEIQELLTGR